MKEPLTPAQMRKIWAMAKQFDLDEDLLRTVVKRLTNQERISQLTKQQARKVIEELEQRANGRPGMASQKQIWKIRQLEKDLGWDQNPARLRAFLKKYYRVDRPEWLTGRAAWRAIESLKKIKERGTDAGAAGQGHN